MQIANAEQAYKCLRHLALLRVEEFWALALGPRKNLIASKMLFRGTVDRCPIHPRDVFRFACIENASSLLVAHNHPSDDPQPSREDIEITERLAVAGELLEIPVIDHLIVAKTGYASIAGMRGRDRVREIGLRAPAY
jgi:DNA repair protein RadC